MTYRDCVVIKSINCWIIMLLHKYSKAVNRIENNRIEWCESKSNRIENFVNRCSPSILAFLWLSLLWKGFGPWFVQFEFPLPTDDWYQVWLKLASWFWRRVLRIFNEFLLFCYYLHFRKEAIFNMHNSEFHLPKDDLCQLWLKLTWRFWRRSQQEYRQRYIIRPWKS